MTVSTGSRVSGFRGSWKPNQRPYVTLTPDVYVALQGETSVIACGECQRKININHYVTGISTEASVDSPPGSATINLSIPDNDINNFYVDGQLVIISMMEVEIYSKGYYLIGGVPQYYRIFWGLISTVTKDWSAGSTTISISCRDILRWWELTNSNVNPSFMELASVGAGSYDLWQNRFAGLNPITTIMQLAQESMGDFASNNQSIGQAFGGIPSGTPEKGPEAPVIGSYAQDMMVYWQLKFANIWRNLRIYGTSGRSYQFTTSDGTASTVKLAASIFQSEQQLNTYDTTITHPEEVSVFKKELDKAGTVDFTQNEIQSRLSIAMQARDQAGWELFVDPSGDIVFKPPFYNLNVIPNKPVSWINDFEIIDDSITDTEQEVYTHITSQGIAFGGVGFDAGITDEVTAPRTGVFDFHLLRRYGFRRIDYPTEWAYDPRKLFFHLMDYLDRLNAKRTNGTITIPLRPELRLGFPIWVPYYDSFFYIQGIAHQFSVGGQATTTLTLIGKRSKYIAPRNIGQITAGKTTQSTINTNNSSGGVNQKKTIAVKTYNVAFPDNVGASAGIITTQGNNAVGTPVSIRDPKTGKLLGFPNVVMVFRDFLGADSFQKIAQASGSSTYKAPIAGVPAQHKSTSVTIGQTNVSASVTALIKNAAKYQLIQRASQNRYGAAMTNNGVYDYAHDTTGDFIELNLVPATSFNIPGNDPSSNDPIIQALNKANGDTSPTSSAQNAQQLNDAIVKAQQAVKDAQNKVTITANAVTQLQKQKASANSGNSSTSTGNTSNVNFVSSATPGVTSNVSSQSATAGTQALAASDALISAQADAANAVTNLKTAQTTLANLQAGIGSLKKLKTLSIMVRPVSDEFGFEVIGHYRYGRGAYIDRGQIRLGLGSDSQSSGTPANQIQTQFAATGGILTDPSTIQSGSGSYLNFAEQFDQMQPEDWQTGASFRGVAASGTSVDNPTSGVVLTDATTYSSNMKKNTGHSVFIEADQIQSSKTLGEMGPSVDLQGLQGVAMQCACGLQRADWLSVLPSDFIQDVINGSIQTYPANTITESNGNTIVHTTEFGVGTAQTIGVGDSLLAGPDGGQSAIVGTVTPASFFSVLQNYLASNFEKDYKQNANRELQDTGQSQGVTTQLFNADEQNNILGDPTDNPLFGPASLGDPSALAGLQSEVNFGFGQTANAIANFSSAFQNGQQSINQDLAQALPGGPLIPLTPTLGASVSVSSGQGSTQIISPDIGTTTSSTPQQPVPSPTGVKVTTATPQVQPVTVQPVPNLKQMILNPSTNTKLATAQYNAIPGSGGAPDQLPPYLRSSLDESPTKVGQD